MTSMTPTFFNRRSAISSSVRPATSTSALGRLSVNGRRRVPKPAARIIAFIGPFSPASSTSPTRYVEPPHRDPFDPDHWFVSFADLGLFESFKSGSAWKEATSRGIPREWVNTAYWAVFDPEVKGRIWAVMSNTHDLPRPKMWRARGVKNFGGGVVISEDGGRSWKPSVEGMGQTAATHILLDPKSPAGNRTLYVCGFGKGVYKSTDGGRHWVLKNSGLEGAEPFAWRLVPDSRGQLYLLVARRGEDGNVGTPLDGALYQIGRAHV